MALTGNIINAVRDNFIGRRVDKCPFGGCDVTAEATEPETRPEVDDCAGADSLALRRNAERPRAFETLPNPIAGNQTTFSCRLGRDSRVASD